MSKKCNDPLNEFDSDEDEDLSGPAKDFRPAHKVTRQLGSPVKNQKRGVSSSPTKRQWKIEAQNLKKQLETQIQIDMNKL